MSDLSDVEKAIGYKFKNHHLIVEALTHSSYNDDGFNNSFLALLGSDAIRFIVIKELVARRLGAASIISRIRDNLHNKSVMLELASKFGLENYFLISERVKNNSSVGFQNALISAIEALVGAIFSDGGYGALEGFAQRFLFPRISETKVKDPKTLLQEAMQARGDITPTYRSLEELGPEHNKVFVVGVYAGNHLIARGEGPTIKDAGKAAAQKALDNITRT